MRTRFWTLLALGSLTLVGASISLRGGTRPPLAAQSVPPSQVGAPGTLPTNGKGTAGKLGPKGEKVDSYDLILQTTINGSPKLHVVGTAHFIEGPKGTLLRLLTTKAHPLTQQDKEILGTGIWMTTAGVDQAKTVSIEAASLATYVFNKWRMAPQTKDTTGTLQQDSGMGQSLWRWTTSPKEGPWAQVTFSPVTLLSLDVGQGGAVTLPHAHWQGSIQGGYKALYDPLTNSLKEAKGHEVWKVAHMGGAMPFDVTVETQFTLEARATPGSMASLDQPLTTPEETSRAPIQMGVPVPVGYRGLATVERWLEPGAFEGKSQESQRIKEYFVLKSWLREQPHQAKALGEALTSLESTHPDFHLAFMALTQTPGKEAQGAVERILQEKRGDPSALRTLVPVVGMMPNPGPDVQKALQGLSSKGNTVQNHEQQMADLALGVMARTIREKDGDTQRAHSILYPYIDSLKADSSLETLTHSLGVLGNGGAPELIQERERRLVLSHPSPELHAEYASSLRFVHDPKVVTILQTLTQNPTADVRGAAWGALSYHGPQEEGWLEAHSQGWGKETDPSIKQKIADNLFAAAHLHGPSLTLFEKLARSENPQSPMATYLSARLQRLKGEAAL